MNNKNSAKFALAAACMLLAQHATYAADEGIQWLSSPHEAAALAHKTGRPILVYVRSTSCHYCDLMQQQVWQHPTTANIIMREFVALKVTKEDNPAASRAMQVTGYPSTIIFSADRNYITRLDGFLTNEKFLTAISEIRTASVEAQSRSDTREASR